METGSAKETAKQILSAYLVSNGYRKTPERFAVLDAIASFEGHFDIELLDEELHKQNFRVSKATLYNTITLLLTCKLIVKNQFGSTPQYEKTFNTNAHNHLICATCRNITEFQNNELMGVLKKLKLPKFSMTHYSISLYGECSKCAWARNSKEKKRKKAATTKQLAKNSETLEAPNKNRKQTK